MHKPNVRWSDLEAQWTKDEHQELVNTIMLLVAWGGLTLLALVLAFWPELV